MFYETVLDMEDKSYYTDRLNELTGKPRSYWAGVSLFRLRECLKRAVMKKKGVKRHAAGAIF